MVIDRTVSIKKILKPDILIIHDNPKINLERILENIQPKIVVFSAKNYKNNINTWEKVLSKKKITFHNMYDDGAYIID